MRGLAAIFCAGALAAACATGAGAPAAHHSEHVVIDRARVDAALQSYVEAHRLVGVSALVYQHGREAYFGAFGFADREANRPMRRDTLAQIYSMTKPVVGVALMTLYEQGKFQLDDPISRYLPEFAHMRVYAGADASGAPITVPLRREITVRDIMSHQAGFAEAFGDGPVNVLMRNTVGEPGYDIDLSELARRVASVPLMAQPGERWMYSFSVDLQALMIERLTGQPLEQVLQQRVFTPLHMRDTSYFVPEGKRTRVAAIYDLHPEGLVRQPDERQYHFNFHEWRLRQGSLGLVSTLDDYMRFARMLVNGGELDGARILRQETVRLMATNQLADSITQRSFLPTKGRLGFGLDFAVRVAPAQTSEEMPGVPGEFFWDGLANTLFWVDPENDLTAVLFTQYMPPQGTLVHKSFREAVYGLRVTPP